jgi:hypothetical protein
MLRAMRLSAGEPGKVGLRVKPLGAWRSASIRTGKATMSLILGEDVLRLARQMLYRHPLRSADAIHLASALLLARTSPTARWSFVCADGRLCDAAKAEGFQPIFTANDSA